MGDWGPGSTREEIPPPFRPFSEMGRKQTRVGNGSPFSAVLGNRSGTGREWVPILGRFRKRVGNGSGTGPDRFLCCPLANVDESRSVSRSRTSLSGALTPFCLGP